MPTIKAYSYLRISTENQSVGDGIRRQMEASAEYAEKHGYELVETIQDLGVSAFKSKHAKEGAFAALLEAIDKGVIEPGSVLIVESLDRLSRDDVLSAFSQFSSILNKGIQIVTLMDNQKYTKEGITTNPGQLFMSLGIMLRAQDESATKSKRIKAAWSKKRDNADKAKITGRCPAWLKLNEDKTEFIVDPTSAATISKIFDLSISGMGMHAIATYLNADPKKYPCFSGASAWFKSYVATILKSPRMIGQFQPHEYVNGKRKPVGDPLDDYYPAIVDENKFYLVQTGINKRANGGGGRKGKTFSNLFTNVAKCGTCGGSMIYRNTGKSADARTLHCNNAVVKKGCSCPQWKYSEFESAFFEFCAEINFTDILKTKDSDDQATNIREQRSDAEDRLESLSAQLDHLMDQIAKPAIQDRPSVLDNMLKRVDTTEAEIETTKETIENLDRELASLSSQDVDADQAEFMALYKITTEDLPDEEKRLIRARINNLMKKHIKVIKVYNDMSINPWEAEDHLSDRIKEAIGKSGTDLENFVGTAHGQRFINSMERYFVIQFSNGFERTVAPGLDSSLISRGPGPASEHSLKVWRAVKRS